MPTPDDPHHLITDYSVDPAGDDADLVEDDTLDVRALMTAAILGGALAGGGAEGLTRLVRKGEAGVEPTELGQQAVEAAGCLADEMLWRLHPVKG